jgi:hypothetical protein
MEKRQKWRQERGDRKINGKRSEEKNGSSWRNEGD